MATDPNAARKPFLFGMLAGIVLTFAGTQLLMGGGSEPEVARIAPEPYAAATPMESADAAIESIEGETFLDSTLGSAEAANAP